MVFLCKSVFSFPASNRIWFLGENRGYALFLPSTTFGYTSLRERVKTHIGGDDKRQRIADEILRFIYDEKFDAGDGINYAPDHDIPAYKEVFEMIFEALSQKSHYLKMSGVGE